MTTHTLVLPTDGHVDFAYALETYLIYPWVSDGNVLVRPLRIGADDAAVAVTRVRQTRPQELTAIVELDDDVPNPLAEIRAILERCLQTTYPRSQIEALAAEDPILRAAVAHRGLGRGKLYPDLFEALCGVVCAKRTTFNRVPGMMRNLAEAFGPATADKVDGRTIHAFPTPATLAAATDEQIRDCKVGFRAKDLANIAGYLTEIGYSWHTWRTREPSHVIQDLQGIRGVGPYTANLAINLVYGTGGTAHVDTYVQDVIGRLYLNKPDATLAEVAAFVDIRWGAMGETVLDYLTTDTEQWVTTLGKTVGVRSGARA